MADARKEQREPEVERDERFPSGPWKGFWLQRGMTGRQWMKDVSLTFRDGTISGQGSDWVGDFVFRGRYTLEDGKCTLVKRYVGGHQVIYQGCSEGERLWLWGVWEIRAFDRGGFHLWPKGEGDPTGEELAAEADEPVRVLVGSV